jgi:hypothetical protein
VFDLWIGLKLDAGLERNQDLTNHFDLPLHYSLLGSVHDHTWRNFEDFEATTESL